MVMSEEKTRQNKLYVRRKGQIKGPFPVKQVSRFILLGRILQTDELSRDKKVWKPVKEHPEQAPE